MSDESAGISGAAARPTAREPLVLGGRFALAAVALVSIWVPKLALFVLVGSFIAFLSVGRESRRAHKILAIIAVLGSGAGFLRFLVTEAMPGIVQGGTTATGAAAVSRLREISFAEDVMRQKALVDPDSDGVGSAALLAELTGDIGLRRGTPLAPPLLERYPAPLETALGPAYEVAGYLFAVCLPKLGGGFTARPEDAVDEELAERRFVAYAWPASEGGGFTDAYFIDEHERILFARSGAPKGRRTRMGPERPPSCDDALATSTREEWQVWRNKRARRTLPGAEAEP